MDTERAIREHDRLQTANQPHRRGVSEENRLFVEAGTVLGRLFLRGSITRSQYNAGEEYNKRYGEYRACGEGPRGLTNGGRGYECNPDSCDPKECRCIKVKWAFRDLDNALRSGEYHASRNVVWAVQWVCLHDHSLMESEFRFLKTGLIRMAGYLRLDKRS